MGIFSKKEKRALPHTPVPVEKVDAPNERGRRTMHVPRTLLKVHMSEKMHSGTSHTYVFVVNEHATKPLIRKTVESEYGVRVQGVRVVRRAGKVRYYRGKPALHARMKKAIVTLTPGDHIDLT